MVVQERLEISEYIDKMPEWVKDLVTGEGFNEICSQLFQKIDEDGNGVRLAGCKHSQNSVLTARLADASRESQNGILNIMFWCLTLGCERIEGEGAFKNE